MISVAHFNSAEPDFGERAQLALTTLAARPGYLHGSLARSTDEDDAGADHWVIVTEWESVGAYRRALGAFEVKLHATPLLGEAIDLPSGFEVLVDVDHDGRLRLHTSDRAEGER
ncbi:MAG TPA: antibiotic biosynthesis monooxygenase [Jatrophihabitans sp.]|jgi:hypothetical protein